MNIEAFYENGRLELPAHIRLTRQRIKVRLDIPDDAVSTESHLDQHAPEGSDIRERIQSILGSDRDKMIEAAATDESAQAIWHQHLEEKYLGRD